MFCTFTQLSKATARTLATLSLAALLSLPASARIGPPIQLTLATPDTPRVGEASVIHVVIQGGADVPHAEYVLQPPAGWQIVEGPTQWVGAVKAGEKIEFKLRAIPLSDTPGAISAQVRIPRHNPLQATLPQERMGRNFPENSREETNAKANGRAAASEEEPIQAVFADDEVLPQPANARAPRVPGDPEAEQPIREFKQRKERGAAVSITATGRFTYLDDNNIRRGVRNATVELWNENPFPSLGDERCAQGITDANGNFTLGANCGDFFDGPDLYMKIVLNNSVVEVKPEGLFSGTYTFRTGTRQNSAGGVVNFGTITITSNRPAYQAHNIIMRAQQFMATLNESMTKLTVNWPGDGTFYSPFFDSITLEAAMPFGEEGAVYHEYGHHVLDTKAESPAPDYDNGICDFGGDPGHCLFAPENGDIAWTEGWPDFFAAFLHAQFNVADGYGPTMMSFETRPDPFEFPGQEDHTEGIIAAILWDLTDAANDDQGAQGPGRRDNFQMSFASTWNVVKNFDPSAGLFHNHPTNIHEFWRGLRETQLNNINRISEVYREHQIVKPQPDLRMTSVANPPTILPRGTSFQLNNNVRNEGNELANNAFTVRFQLQNTATGALITVGTRTVPAGLSAGANNNTPVQLTVPVTTPAGTYRIRTCADSGSVVPESDETDNCLNSTGTANVP